MVHSHPGEEGERGEGEEGDSKAECRCAQVKSAQ